MKSKMEKAVNIGRMLHLENSKKENINNKNKSGISLIVLVITILVIVVLAGAVIITVAKNNPFDKANQAVFQSDLKNFESELGLKIASMMIQDPSVDPNDINADFETPNNLLEEYIPSIKGKNKYKKIVIVERGKLVLKKTELSPDEEKWADEIGIPTIGKPIVSKIKDIVLESGMNNIKVKVLVDESENTVESYKYEIGKTENTLVVKDTNALKDYTFNGLEVNTKYFVKVTIKDKNNITEIKPMVKEITTGAAVVEPGSVKITKTPNLGNGAYTNQNVTATITYPEIAGLKCRYSYNGTIWEDYTAALILTKNTTVYAKMTYLNDEEIAQGPGPSTATETQIDKLKPTVTNFTYTVTHNSINITGVTATDAVATSDNAMSGILKYIYSITGGYTNAPGIAGTTVTIPDLSPSTTYEVEVQAVDKAGNSGSKKINITTDVPPIVKEELASINRTADGLPPSYSNPMIPRGFKPINVDNNGNKVSEHQITRLKPKIPTFVVAEKSYNSLTVKVHSEGEDNQDVSGYMYSLDDKNWTGKEGDTKVFSNLNANTNYTIYVKAVAKDGIIGDVGTKTYQTLTMGHAPSNKTYDGGTPSYSNPMIPRGFKPITIE